ncbi:MAG: transporter substrate-binding protein [Isosphaerales bacterium]
MQHKERTRGIDHVEEIGDCSPHLAETIVLNHSQTGGTEISEQSMIDAEVLALEEINANGGLHGRRVEWVKADVRSDWPTFAREAEWLIEQEKVSVIFGCWTAASRKSVKRVVEQKSHLLTGRDHDHQGRRSDQSALDQRGNRGRESRRVRPGLPGRRP